ncbi:MAG: hypothetical protein C0518_12245 [Opitutus sp.]|nr:hypothetical protein [Opitutus sp.]
MSRVYFFCRDNRHAYQDDVVVLAEGLRALGHEVFGNCNYWQRSLDPADYLVRHDAAVAPQDCDIVVVSYGWTRWIDQSFKYHTAPLPAGLFAAGRRYRTAYLDLEDGYLTGSHAPEYRQFDRVFRAKYNERCFHPTNHVPWVLGLSSRMIDHTADALPWSERNRDVLVNFNASHPFVHPARTLMEKHFTPRVARLFHVNRERDDLKAAPADPLDRHWWEQTQQRHSRSYYERLKRSQAVAAFCGEMIPPAPFRPPYLVGGGRAKLSRRFYETLAKFAPRAPRLIQWDSWRFWESLAAGCLVFNFDLPHYGVKIPVMPENFVHYVGVRPETIDDALDRLAEEPGLAERIAAQGRQWALSHYSPAALAARFLQSLA